MIQRFEMKHEESGETLWGYCILDLKGWRWTGRTDFISKEEVGK